MEETFGFNEEGIRKLVAMYRDFERRFRKLDFFMSNYTDSEKFDELIVCELQEDLNNTNQAHAMKMYRPTEGDPFEPITEDEFYVEGPTIPDDKCILAETIVFVFYCRSNDAWYVFNAKDCAVDCPE